MHPKNQETQRPDQRERDVDPDLMDDEDLALSEQPSFSPDEDEPKKDRAETERELDHGLKETFPASDPVSINPGAD